MGSRRARGFGKTLRKPLQVWAERAKLGEQQVNLAAAARLWAERRAGELLIASRENGTRDTGQGGDRRSQSQEPTVKLDDLGLSKHESSRYQQLAGKTSP